MTISGGEHLWTSRGPKESPWTLALSCNGVYHPGELFASGVVGRAGRTISDIFRAGIEFAYDAGTNRDVVTLPGEGETLDFSGRSADRDVVSSDGVSSPSLPKEREYTLLTFRERYAPRLWAGLELGKGVQYRGYSPVDLSALDPEDRARLELSASIGPEALREGSFVGWAPLTVKIGAALLFRLVGDRSEREKQLAVRVAASETGILLPGGYLGYSSHLGNPSRFSSVAEVGLVGRL